MSFGRVGQRNRRESELFQYNIKKNSWPWPGTVFLVWTSLSRSGVRVPISKCQTGDCRDIITIIHFIGIAYAKNVSLIVFWKWYM